MYKPAELRLLCLLSELTPQEIEPIYVDCIHIYWEEGFKKALGIVLFAITYNLAIRESFELQKMIDLYLL